MGRADFRREKKLLEKTSNVAKKTGIKVEELLKWRQEEHDALEREICLEYQRKLERAEDLILAAMVFASMNAVRDTWRIKLDLQKFFDNLMKERDLIFKEHGSEGIKKAYERVHAESGMDFEFDDMDLNEEFHLLEWESHQISKMKPNEAYDFGWDEASILNNIMHTVMLADELYGKTVIFDDQEIYMDKDHIMMMLSNMNKKCAGMLQDGIMTGGTGGLTKKIAELEARTGINFGDDIRNKVSLYNL